MCVVMLVGILPVGASAGMQAEEVMPQRTVETINEYERYREMELKSNAELLDMGLTLADIQEFRAFDYEAEVLKRAKLDEEILVGAGYNSEQIAALKELVTLEGKIVPQTYRDALYSAASPWVDLTTDTDLATISGQDSKFIVILTWEWSAVPFALSTDTVSTAAIGYDSSGDTYRMEMDTSGTYVDLTWYAKGIHESAATPRDSSPQRLSWQHSYSEHFYYQDGLSIGYRFDIGSQSFNGGYFSYEYVKEGRLHTTYNIESDGADRVIVNGGYAHASVASITGHVMEYALVLSPFNVLANAALSIVSSTLINIGYDIVEHGDVILYT